MAYQPIARYQLIDTPPYSAYSHPRHDHPDGCYKIHLVKAPEPDRLPGNHPTAAEAGVRTCAEAANSEE